MKKAIVILGVGLVAAVAGYSAFHFYSTACNREMLGDQTPELAWLKKQFHLTDAEYARITELHDAYLPACQERCRRIAAKDAELKELLTKTNSLSPEVETKLKEAAQLRVECQTAMLKHFYAVSQTMAPAQGQRYLAWVQEKTFLSDHGMNRTAESSRPAHDRPHE
jgi:Spy/CpxP family protein refolding chaperone